MKKCEYFPKCNACSSWNINYDTQMSDKIALLKSKMHTAKINYTGEVKFISAGDRALREKADFGMEFNETSGSFDIGYFDSNGKILDIKKCLQFSPELQLVFDEFRQIKFPTNLNIKKVSVRLRNGIKNIKGVWFDLANIDIKKLLIEENYLKNLAKQNFIIEMGQKNKVVTFSSSGVSLGAPILYPWFKTKNKSSDEVVCSYISSFTQPGWKTGELLLNELKQSLLVSKPKRIVEFGSGIGYFSLLLADMSQKLTLLESEKNNEAALKSNLAAYQNFDIIFGDFHRKKISGNYDLAFVNPARSGLKDFSNNLIELRPEKIIYVSCYPDSMMNDLITFSSKYRICNISIIDQFPQTLHFEVYCELERLS